VRDELGDRVSVGERMRSRFAEVHVVQQLTERRAMPGWAGEDLSELASEECGGRGIGHDSLLDREP
jgi:hypothetical protein